METLDSEINRIKEYNKRLTEYTQYLESRASLKALEKLSEDRGYSVEFLKSIGVFYIAKEAEMLAPKYLNELKNFGVISLTNNRPIFNDRYVIPIKDENGLVQNLVGYSKNANERYVYGTAQYYLRRDTYYGMENIEEAFKLGWAIVTEGITDSWVYRSGGIKNAFANCGTHSNKLGVNLLNHLRYGVIVVGDRDKAGEKAYKRWKFDRKVKLNTSIAFKDSDEMCRHNDKNKEILFDVLRQIIADLTSIDRTGTNYFREVTIR